jgi:hypothetical protein
MSGLALTSRCLFWKRQRSLRQTAVNHEREISEALCEDITMTDTIATVAVLGFILFGIIPFGYDWAMAFKTMESTDV